MRGLKTNCYCEIIVVLWLLPLSRRRRCSTLCSSFQRPFIDTKSKLKSVSLSVTCADDRRALHVLQQFGDGGVVAGVQGVAVDPQVELEPAGVGVKGHLMHGHADVGHGGRLAVMPEVPDREVNLHKKDTKWPNKCNVMAYNGNLPALPGELNWLINLITLTRWLRGNVSWEISSRKDTQMIQFDWKINFFTEPPPSGPRNKEPSTFKVSLARLFKAS